MFKNEHIYQLSLKKKEVNIQFSENLIGNDLENNLQKHYQQYSNLSHNFFTKENLNILSKIEELEKLDDQNEMEDMFQEKNGDSIKNILVSSQKKLQLFNSLFQDYSNIQTKHNK